MPILIEKDPKKAAVEKSLAEAEARSTRFLERLLSERLAIRKAIRIPKQTIPTEWPN